MTAAEIKALRAALDMTQEMLAVEVKCCLETVKRWEQKRARPSRKAVRRLNKLAAGVGVGHV